MKWNQCTGGWKETDVPWLHMSLYASVWWNWMCYVWWLSYRLVCNHYGWNETSVLGVERKSRYHDYTCTYKLQNGWIWLLLWLNDECICNHFDWNEIRVLGIERKSRDWKEIKVRWLQMDHYEVNEFEIKYESLWLNVKLSFIRLKNSYLHL